MTATATVQRSDTAPRPQPSQGSRPAAEEKAQVAPAAPKKSKRSAILFLVASISLLGAAGYWYTHHGLEHTDDAQLDADIIAVPSRTSGTVTAIHFTDNMHVKEGDLLFELDSAPAAAKLAQAEAEVLAAQASAGAAEATASLTERNVDAGRSIARASLTGAAAQVTTSNDQFAELNANLAASKAMRDRAQVDYERAQALKQTGAIASAELDAARTALENAQGMMDQAAARIVTLKSTTSQAKAHVSEAQARLAQASDTAPAQVAEANARAASAKARIATTEAARDLARLELSYTKIYAPHAGIVSKRSVAVGQLVAQGQTVVVVVPDAHDTDAVWVTGNFKETQLADMRVGQPATLTIDAYGREVHGHVESFSGATGARFALLPPDNATGNFTKVVQRVPVRVKLDDVPPDVLLIPGLSVDLTINTRQ
ncbi:MAG TPA: HlyD family secretion protein [Polyangiaceae bacterium]|jgi:membrane fusion protein (multidrug efflux system)|nr:HlyD family secretion protein [Polyangiaceae bacterium]